MLVKQKPPAILMAIALIYLSLLLLIPAIAIFYEAFHQGINVFLTSVNQRDFWQATILTLSDFSFTRRINSNLQRNTRNKNPSLTLIT